MTDTTSKHRFQSAGPRAGGLDPLCTCGEPHWASSHFTEGELEIQRQIGELVGTMIRDADARNANPETILSSSAALAALHAHTDAMRDLREALARLGYLS